MFNKSAEFYDAIYESKGKNYEEEVAELVRLLSRLDVPQGGRLLEIACGNGNHTRFLRDHFQVEGLDLDPNMLSIARQRYPETRFHHQDMATFRLEGRFDAIICLFSAIGYVRDIDRLHLAIRTMAEHLLPGGVLLVEPWIGPQDYRPGGVFSVFVDRPDLKIARMNVNRVRGTVSVLNFHYLVATPAGVHHFTELHELGLFTPEEYRSAFAAAGLETEFLPKGLVSRGMYVGRKG